MCIVKSPNRSASSVRSAISTFHPSGAASLSVAITIHMASLRDCETASCLCRFVRDFNDQLALVRAIEQLVERGGRVLQSFDDIDAVLELAFHPPLAHLHDGFQRARHVIRDQEAFEP